MSAAQRERLGRPATDSASAYDLYLRAGSLNYSDPEKQSFLEQAVALDPLFADAFAALAKVHLDVWLGLTRGLTRPAEASLTATKLAEKLKKAEELGLINHLRRS